MSVEGTWWSGEGAQMNVDGHGEWVGGMEGVPRLCRVLQRVCRRCTEGHGGFAERAQRRH